MVGSDPTPAGLLSLIISSHNDFSPSHIARFEAVGVVTGASAGGVMAARAPISAVPELVAMSFVDYVELAGRVYLEDMAAG